MRSVPGVLFAVLFALSAHANSLIIEGPTERGDGRLPAGGGTLTVDVYGENLPSVGIVQVALLFKKSGVPASGFQISLTGGNPDFGGQAIFVNTDIFPRIVPIYDTDRQLAGLVSFGPVNITQKTRIFTIVYDYPADAAGAFAIQPLEATTLVTDLSSNNIPFTSLFGSAIIGQVTYCVDDDAPADFSTIQAAINASGDGDTIIVKDGSYRGSGNHDIDFGGRKITVRSQNGPAACIVHVEATPAMHHRAFYFHSGEDASSVVEGFTIEDGYADDGGAIRCEGASPSIIRNVLKYNTAVQSGGAVSCDASSAPLIKGCLIVNNQSSGIGGAISCSGGSALTIANCTIASNSAVTAGGAISCLGAVTALTNTVLWGNTAASGAQLALNGPEAPSQASVDFCSVAGGQPAVSVAEGSTLAWGAGNIDAAVVFVSGSNYHLDRTSQCINAGDPAYAAAPAELDLDGLARVQDGRLDIGAYEVVPLRTWYVDDNAPSDPGPGNPLVSDPLENGSTAHPFDAIQEAIDAAVTEETIIVKNGIYTGTGNRDIELKYKAITVRSEHGAALATIDCQGSPNTPHRAFYLHTHETAATIIDGFTIRNGYASGATIGNVAGGILCGGNSLITIRNCIITNCTADAGGGIYATYSEVSLIDCQVKTCTATMSGGGFGCVDSTVTIRGCTFSENKAQYSGPYGFPLPNGQGGGAIFCRQSTSTIENNTIQSNTIPGAYANGAGILLTSSTATVTGNTITQNTATGNGGNGGGLLAVNGTATISGNTVTNNTANASAGIGCYSCPVTINANTITGNTGSALQVNGPPVPLGEWIDVTIAGNKISNNTGFAVFCNWGVDVAMTENEITGNSCPGDQGGGVNWSSGVRGTIANNTISSNYSGYFGGGIMLSTTEEGVVVTGNTISDNTAKYVAGGMHLWNTGGTIANNTITRNHANGISSMEIWEGGGAIFANVPLVPLLITGNTISDNTSAQDGGAIHLVQTASFSTPVTFSGNTITGNTAVNGGAVSWYEGDQLKAVFTGNTISDNTATAKGGAFYCTRQCAGSITGGRIENNRVTAGSGGAIYCEDGSNVPITNVILAGNTATGKGGAIASTNSAPVIVSSTLAANSAAEGGAFYCTWDAPTGTAPRIRNSILWGNTAALGPRSALTP